MTNNEKNLEETEKLNNEFEDLLLDFTLGQDVTIRELDSKYKKLKKHLTKIRKDVLNKSV